MLLLCSLLNVHTIDNMNIRNNAENYKRITDINNYIVTIYNLFNISFTSLIDKL